MTGVFWKARFGRSLGTIEGSGPIGRKDTLGRGAFGDLRNSLRRARRGSRGPLSFASGRYYENSALLVTPGLMPINIFGRKTSCPSIRFLVEAPARSYLSDKR